jgi:hypothetical protein
MQELSEEHIDVLNRAEALGLDTFGYAVKGARWHRLKERVEAREAAIAEKPATTEDDANPRPTLVEVGAAKYNTARATEARERERRIPRILEAQGWRCAVSCGGNGEGRPMLPGEAFAYIDDHEGIVHVECLKAGTVPSEGNPWTINGALRSKP